MGLKPINDRIIVRRKDRAEKSPGGILLPDAAREKPSRGEVLAVGPGAWNKDHTARVPMSVKVGDIVVFSKWSGADHDYKEMGDIAILGESDVLAVEE